MVSAKKKGSKHGYRSRPAYAASSSPNPPDQFATAADVAKQDERLEMLVGSMEKVSQIAVPVVEELKRV